jgi:hypothetical protein
MKKILTEAAAVGNITARALAYKSRIPEAYFYKNSAWNSPFIGGSYQFLKEPGVRNRAASGNILESRRRICDGVDNTDGLASGWWAARAT